MSVIDNLLADTNQDSWKQLERVNLLFGTFIVLCTLLQTSPSTSQALVSGAEKVTQLLSETLNNDTTKVIKAKPNIGKVARPLGIIVVYFLTCLFIVIKAERVSNSSVDKDYTFPDEDDNLAAYSGGNAQLMVPIGLLQNISKNFLFLL